MKKNTKAAIEASTLVLYIILVATTLTLAGAVTMYVKLGSEDAAKKACELDITKAYLSKLFPKMISRGEAIFGLTNCRRDKLGKLIIRYEDVVENGAINQDKAHKKIADGMIECWKMTGAGTKDPFSNWDNMDTSYCLICEPIEFDDKLINFMKEGNQKLTRLAEKGEIEITEEELSKYNILSINDYLATEEYKPGVKIAEYLYKTESNSLNQENIKKAMEDKGMEQKTAIIFPDSLIMIRMYKYEAKSTVKVLVGAIAGAVLFVGGVILIFTGIGAGLGAGLIALAAKIGISVAVAGLVSSAVLIPTAYEAFDACIPECNAIGGVGIVPAPFDLNTKLPIIVDGEEKETAICDIIVN